MNGLVLSIGDGNWQEKMWSEIFDRAKKKGRVVSTNLGDYRFQYALINPEDGYEGEGVFTEGVPYQYCNDLVTFWIKDAEKEGRVGLNHGDFAFVLERELPRHDFADYIGLHEYIETTGGLYRHGEACRIELGELFKRDSDFVDSYAGWIVGLNKNMKEPKKGYFGRAIPQMIKIIEEGGLSPSEILREFKTQLDSGVHKEECL